MLPHLRFTVLTEEPTYIYYFKSRNAYRIFGKVRVTDTKIRGYRRVVEDGWLAAPYKTDKVPDLPGEFQMRIDKPGDYREFFLPDDHHGFGAERIQNIGNGPLILMMEGASIIFYGEAKVYPQGTVYHDGQMAELQRICSRGPNDQYDIANADFGNLPTSEIKAMKAEMEKHNAAYRRFYRDQEIARGLVPDDAERTGPWCPGYGGQDNYFLTDPEVGMTLYYIPSRDSIYVAGRAKLVYRDSRFRRIERMVENEEVKAPGPEYARCHEDRQKKLRQIKEYEKQHTKLHFDEWVKQHPELD